jgi:hypothetical protein
VSLNENWASAPREVRLIIALIVGGNALQALIYGAAFGVLHPAVVWLRLLSVLIGLSFGIWLIWKLLSRRRWAWTVLWCLTLLGILSAVVGIGKNRVLILQIVSLASSLPTLILMSRASVRSWVPAHRT